MLEFRNVWKRYSNNTLALKGVNLEIQKGEFVFIVGPSGSGKSTLLKLLIREGDVSQGTVYLNGHDITALPRKYIPWLRRSIGIVFQDFRLLPNKTVYENVAFAMQIAEVSPKEIRRQVPMCLALVGLSKSAYQYPHQLSGGEQQRVAVARALVNNPFILIADEPTGNLDPENSWEIMKLLTEINNRGTTVIVATHEMNIVNSMKKRVVALEGGMIVRDQEKGTYSDEDTDDKICI